jgi:hypothetical protein
MVSHNPLRSGGIPDKIDLKFLMIMKRKIKVTFLPRKDHEAVAFRQRRDFPYGLLVHKQIK